ncbi:MAG: spore coat protein CotJB [Eubacteriales bacterium]|nr:spore coat protein CotJB [Eubacteriales bacterium]
MTPREALLEKIQVQCFALNDLCLFLDTHPANADALAAFQECLQNKQKLCAEFASLYTPLTLEQMGQQEFWSWVNDPWPWQSQAGGTV